MMRKIFRKKRMLYRFLIFICSIFILLCSFNVALAINIKPNNDNMCIVNEKTNKYNKPSNEPIGKIIENKKTQKNITPDSQKQNYTMSDLNKLNYNDLIKLLTSIKSTDILDLFKYSTDAYEFYNDKNRIEALITALYDRGSQFTSTDNKGIPTLVEVIRAGFYLGFYHDDLSYLNERNMHDKCIPALIEIEKNPNFKLGTNIQDEIVTCVGLLIWNGSCNVEVVNSATPILEQFIVNFSKYAKENSKGKAVYNIMRGIEYDISMYTNYEAKIPPKDTQWYKKIDSFINKSGDIALIEKPSSNSGWLINNGIFCISSLGKFHTEPDKGLQILTNAMDIHPYLSEQYLEAANEINRNYNGKNYDGKNIDMNKLRKEARDKYYPMTYTFDDGKIIIKTGDKIRKDKIKRLYWASKEVSAQYFRSVDTDEPLESGNPDDILTMIIYNNPEEYQLNRIINELDTNNGGIYIERQGTFYTYERTPKDSIYTLEELFRHEFTHYLQGRYLVPGMWGESEIYKNNRLTWYEEGGAEFFAGSTRTSGVLPRKSIVSNIVNTKSSERYTLSKVLSSTYNDGFEFYIYSCIFMDYLYRKDLYIYDRLANYIKDNDIKSFDNYIKTLSNNYSLNEQYQNHMQRLINNYNNMTTPLVSDDYLIEHPYKNSSEICSEISSVAKLSNVTFTEEKSQFFNTFTLRGTYTGDYYQGKLNDMTKMNNIVDSNLKTLENYNWSGYKTLTCYFTNYRLDSNYNYQFDVIFHGFLPNQNNN